MLEARDLALERGGVTVLAGVDARLHRGQVTAICGPNGAGKSSLLMALAGLLEPVAGSVRLDGAPFEAMPARRRAQRIGYLPQDGEVAWDVAVENLVRLGRLPHRDRGMAPVEAAMTALDLGHLRHRPISRLSGGEKARALLARVLAGEADWILADEPLAALDLAHQQALLRYLRDAAGQGAGVAVVLHDLATAMNHADRVLVLSGGTLAADGLPCEALSAETIARSWGVNMRWIGEAGAMALVRAKG